MFWLYFKFYNGYTLAKGFKSKKVINREKHGYLSNIHFRSRSAGEKFLQQKETPEKFDQQFLNSIGLDEPNTVFYVKLFKVIGLIDEEGRPIKPYYRRFAESDNEARLVISERLPE